MTKVQHKLSISIDILQKDKMKAEKDKMNAEKDKMKAMVRAEIAEKVLQKILKKRKVFRKRKIFTKRLIHCRKGQQLTQSANNLN